MDYDWVVASGKGTLYSHTVVHYPQVPSFDYPLIVGVVELEEGVRIISNIVNIKPEQIEIGMPLEVCFPDTNSDEGIVLHQFQPAQPQRNTTTLKKEEINDEERLTYTPASSGGAVPARSGLAGALKQINHHTLRKWQKFRFHTYSLF